MVQFGLHRMDRQRLTLEGQCVDDVRRAAADAPGIRLALPHRPRVVLPPAAQCDRVMTARPRGHPISHRARQRRADDGDVSRAGGARARRHARRAARHDAAGARSVRVLRAAARRHGSRFTRCRPSTGASARSARTSCCRRSAWRWPSATSVVYTRDLGLRGVAAAGAARAAAARRLRIARLSRGAWPRRCRVCSATRTLAPSAAEAAAARSARAPRVGAGRAYVTITRAARRRTSQARYGPRDASSSSPTAPSAC